MYEKLIPISYLTTKISTLFYSCRTADVVIANNVICGTKTSAINFYRAAGDTPSGNNMLVNNVLCRGADGKTLNFEQPGSWFINNNGYPNGKPSLSGSRGFTGSANFVNPNGNRLTDYKLRGGSPMIGAGTFAPGAEKDAFCSSRSSGRPSVGLHEY